MFLPASYAIIMCIYIYIYFFLYCVMNVFGKNKEKKEEQRKAEDANMNGICDR